MSIGEIKECLEYIRGFVGRFGGEVSVYAANVNLLGEISPNGEIPYGGGTSMRNALLSLVSVRGYSPTIIFTDGYTDTPTPEEVLFSPLLWILTKKHNPNFRPLWGTVLLLPPLPANP